MHGINHGGPCEAQASEYAPVGGARPIGGGRASTPCTIAIPNGGNRRVALSKDGAIPTPEPMPFVEHAAIDDIADEVPR